MLKISNTHSLTVQRKKACTGLGCQAAGLERTLITVKHPGTELDRMPLFHPLEENFKTLMHRLISLSHADPLFQKFIAFCSRAKIAFSYLPF